MSQKVPKILHAIWLDSQPLPDHLRGYRKSWETHLSNYTRHEWTRYNLPLENRFVARQMEKGNFCFASDYLRWERVYEMGGVYFDCDVEVLKPLDPVLDCKGFLGFECIQNRIRKNALGTAIFGFPPGHWLPAKMLNYFQWNPDSTPLATDLLTQIMLTEGLQKFDLETEDFDFVTVRGVRLFHCDILYPDTKRRYLQPEDVPRRSFTIHHVSGLFQPGEIDRLPWLRRLKDCRFDRKILRPIEKTIKKRLGRE
jgi:hypothetical protein